MKKVLSILIIILLFFDSCCYIFVYSELSNYFKKEAFLKINEFVPDEELDVIKVHESDITATNPIIIFINDSEIKYNDELYDIYKVEYSKDSISYYCINDKNENILEKAFFAYVESKTKDNSKNTPIRNILNNLLKTAITPVQFNINFYESCLEFISYNITLKPQYSTEIPTPPPKYNS